MTNKPPPREFDLKQADEIAEEYSKPYSMIDNGNLFFALEEYREAYKTLQAELDRLKKTYCEVFDDRDKLQAELDKAQNIAWDRKCEVRDLKSKLERAESLLRQYKNIDGDINRYFAEVEK